MSRHRPIYETEELANDLIGHAIEVHNRIGAGFPERVYERALAIELEREEIDFERQRDLPVQYRGNVIGKGVADFVVEDRIILELKAVENIAPAHRAQVYSYLRASELRLGFVLNFDNRLLLHGINRVVHHEGEPECTDTD